MYFCTSINMHFLQERKIHVKNLSYRVEIKSNIVILLINQGISGIFHKLTNEKKCAIISKLIRKNNVFCLGLRLLFTSTLPPKHLLNLYSLFQQTKNLN